MRAAFLVVLLAGCVSPAGDTGGAPPPGSEGPPGEARELDLVSGTWLLLEASSAALTLAGENVRTFEACTSLRAGAAAEGERFLVAGGRVYGAGVNSSEALLPSTFSLRSSAAGGETVLVAFWSSSAEVTAGVALGGSGRVLAQGVFGCVASVPPWRGALTTQVDGTTLLRDASVSSAGNGYVSVLVPSDPAAADVVLEASTSAAVAGGERALLPYADGFRVLAREYAGPSPGPLVAYFDGADRLP